MGSIISAAPAAGCSQRTIHLIDYINTKIYSTAQGNFLLSHPTLTGLWTRTRGNTKQACWTSVAEYRGMVFTILDKDDKQAYPELSVQVKGSLHMYWNQGLYNFNDFGMDDLLETVEEFCLDFGFNPTQMKLHGIEVGLNIDLGYAHDWSFYEKLIVLFNTKKCVIPVPICSKDPNSIEKSVVFTLSKQYRLKLYNKDNGALRAEIHISRMAVLRKHFALKHLKLKTLADFCKPENLEAIAKALIIELVDKILFNELIKEDSGISAVDYQFYTDSSNAKKWKNLDPTTRSRNKMRIIHLMKNFVVEPMKQSLIDKLNQKLEKCLQLTRHELLERIQHHNYQAIITESEGLCVSFDHSIEGNIITSMNDNNELAIKKSYKESNETAEIIFNEDVVTESYSGEEAMLTNVVHNQKYCVSSSSKPAEVLKIINDITRSLYESFSLSNESNKGINFLININMLQY